MEVTSPTLANIKVKLSLWDKINLLFKTYWYIIFDIDSWYEKKETSPSKIISMNELGTKLLTNEEIKNTVFRDQPIFREYPKEVVDAGIDLGIQQAEQRIVKDNIISKVSNDVWIVNKEYKPIKRGYGRVSDNMPENAGKGYSKSYTEQRG